jgi:hypothetical protein
MTIPMTSTHRSAAGISRRKVALIAGLGLLLMAVLAPIAHFGVLQTLIVPSDAADTVANITASEGTFRAGVAALLVVAMLDVLVAWGLYVLFRAVNETLALLVAWMRVVYAAVFAIAVANLVDVAQLLGSAQSAMLEPGQLQAQVMSSIASFENGWSIGLAVFGLHLVGLGALVFSSTRWSKLLGGLVVIAGGGYLVDSFATILVPDYGLTVSLVTFVGEALLIVWLFWVAARGFPTSASPRVDDETPAAQPATVATVASAGR